ncbi:PmeII family type II restriction endonuclease [Aminipila luticellarii]|uniref:Restriction endonuclease n=1 Tax=Aminipila luticellarii TaxID=2507160 RepID=A0A410PSD1_9FIRM|nr:PmeII family type II restriction endonuclease [Aminipila luticellarii]QAT41799.1 restriction endonuclease [Aminipila luticellarii]
MNDTFFDKYINEEITYDEFTKQVSLIYESETSVDYNLLGLSVSEFELYKRLGKDALENIISARKHKAEIIQKWKKFFREEIAENHRKNTLKLEHLKEFNLNPFLDNYKANFLLGDSSAKSKATALIYARTLGSSINTTFGTNLQKFCSDILSGYASTTSGIDIEFEDFIDGRRKYCQIKAGPNTINKDDVKTISDHFIGVKNLARTNNLNIGFNDLIVGVFYGEEKDLSGHYKKIKKDYPVYIGQDFWYRLTGDSSFYKELTAAIDEVASEYDGRELLNTVINKLADEIEKAEI